MADLFGRQADTFGGSFSADSATMTFSSGTEGKGGGVGLLTQTISFNYQQQVTRIYEIGSNTSFYIAGRTQGSADLGRVLGPRPISVEFYKKFGDVCQASTNIIDVKMGTACTGTAAQDYAFKLRFCVIMSIGVSVQAQEMMINEQLKMMFCSLEMAGVGSK